MVGSNVPINSALNTNTRMFETGLFGSWASVALPHIIYPPYSKIRFGGVFEIHFAVHPEIQMIAHDI